MLRSDTLFGKKEGDVRNSPIGGPGALGYPGSPRTAGVTVQADAAKASAVVLDSNGEQSGSKLIVGPNIKLKGVEITDCDTLVVEGIVEATIFSRVMQISQQGAFKGAAVIDVAEIHGDFNGELTVKQKLVIFASGKVSGTIRYGKLVVEEGGQICGDVQMGVTGAKSLPLPPVLTEEIPRQH